MLKVQIQPYMFYYNPVEQIVLGIDRDTRVKIGLQDWEVEEPVVIYYEDKRILEIDSEPFKPTKEVQAYFDDIMQKHNTLPNPELSKNIEYKTLEIIRPMDPGSIDDHTGVIRFATQEKPC